MFGTDFLQILSKTRQSRLSQLANRRELASILLHSMSGAEFGPLDPPQVNVAAQLVCGCGALNP
jgi:hypothetical protein